MSISHSNRSSSSTMLRHWSLAIRYCLFCLVGVLSVGGTTASAAVTFGVSTTNGLPASQVLVPVRATNFTSIGLFQFSVRWDSNVLSYVSLEQFGVSGLSSGSFGTTESPNGIIRVSWDDVNGGGVSVPDGTIVFAIRFQLAGSPGSTSAVSIANSPLSIEAADQDLNPVSVTVVNGRVSIDGSATAPSITTQPQSQNVTAGVNVNFSVTASGTAPLSYQWRKDNVNISGATSPTLALTNVQTSQAGNYVVVVANGAGSVTSVVAQLTVNPAATPPSITTQPQSQTVNAGANVNFSVLASGTAPLAYQWRKDGANIGGATSASLALNNVQTSQSGNYTVVITNSAGSITSAVAQLTVNAAPQPPSITTQPQSQTVTVGANVNFSVLASGTAPLSYQWRKDGANIGGATSASLALNNVQTSQSGNYTVVITNTVGSITSSVAQLTVNLPDTTPPSVTITSPTSNPAYTNQQSSINLGGTASDNIGVTQVTWSNDKGGSGTASGTTSWSISSIGLQPGTNILTVIARDAANNTSSDTLAVVYSPVSGTLTFAVANTNGLSGNQVLVPVRATNFTTITLFQFSLAWDPAVISYVGVEQFGLSGLADSNFGNSQAAGGILRVSWDDVNVAGATLPSGGIVFSVRFQLIGGAGSTTPVSITGSPLSIEAADQDLNSVPVSVVQGQVTINQAPTAPSIITQPQSQAVIAGANVNFSVTASGTAPLSYQWRKDGANIGGATSTSLTLSNVQLSQTGDYVCLVANALGSVTSAVARLTVNPAPVAPLVTTQPQSQTVTVGASPSLTIVATGTEPLSYQWRKDGATLTGATSATLPFSNVQLSQAGDYVCVVTNIAGSVTSLVAHLTVNPPPQPPAITAQPQNQSVTVGGSVNFTLAATGADPLSYQWRKENTNIAGATSPILALSNVQLSQAGNYVCVVTNVAGSMTSAVAVLTVNQPPAITSQPQSQTVLVGANVTFSILAAGTAPLNYQWRKDNINIGGASSTSLTLSNVQVSQTGDYVCVVTNVGGSITSAVARLTVNQAPQAPAVVTQPQNQSVTLGSNALFSVVASGTDPLSYQWRKDGTNLAGANSASLVLSNVQVSQAGDYVCLITNIAGSVTSAVARLTVNLPPTITTQPQNQTVVMGSNATFSVVAGGTSPFGYQWRKDGTNLAGANSPNLALSNIQLSQAGDYVCVVTNIAGSVTSAVAHLTVNPPSQAPTITVQPQSQTISAGQNVNFTITASGTAPLAYQWRKDGVTLGGATATNLSLTSVQMSQAGDYTCVVTNMVGAVTSAVARLTVNPPPDTTPPTVTITTPTTNTEITVTNNLLTLAGTASDNVGVIQVSWSNNRGGNGLATGLNSWGITNISLQPGTNILTVTGRDAANNNGSDSIVVTYAPPAPGAMTISVGTTNGLVGTQLLVPVRVSGFTRISLFQFSMHWDPAIVTYMAVEQLGLPGLTSGNFGTSQTANGTLTVSWDDLDITGKTLSDGSIIFSIRFQLANSPGATAQVSINDSPVDIEADNADLLPVPVLVANGQVSIGGGNAAPVMAAIGNKNVAETTTLTFTATATDADLPPQSLTYSLDPGAPSGATINPTNGVFNWTPTEAQGPSTNTITVRVTDNGSPARSDFKTITVTVSELNAPPVLSPIGAKSVNEGQLLTFTAVATDSDIPTQSLTYSLENAPTGAVIHPVSGVFTWTPSEAQAPATVFITVRATDNGSPPQSHSEMIAVTTGEINAAPVLSPITDKSATENTTLTFTAIATDPDLPPQALTFSLEGSTPSSPPPAGASIDPSSGVFSWRPNESQGSNSYVMTIRVRDNGTPSFTNSRSFTVTVAEDNNAPVLIPIGNKSINEGSLLTFTAVASDSDVPAQPLLFSLDPGAPAGASIHPNTGVFTWQTTEADGPSSNRVVIRVTDNGSPPLNAAEAISIIVNDINSPPVLAPILNKAGHEGELCLFTNIATDPDIPAQSLTFTLENGPSGASVNPTNGVFTWTPSAAQRRTTNSMTIRVTDNGVPPLSDSETFLITVDGVNTPPVLDPIGNKAVNENDTLTFTARASDSDSPRQTLVFSLDPDAPTGAFINPATGAFAWTPSESQGPGTHSITVRVIDNGSPPLSSSETIQVQVFEANSPPSMAAIGDKTVLEGTLLSFTVIATDSDSPAQKLTYTVDEGAPAGIAINSTNGLFTWTPTELQGPSTNSVTIRVTDDGSPPFGAFQTIRIVVTELNNLPVLAVITDKSVAEGSALTFTATATDADLPLQVLTYSLEAAPPGATINPTNGVFSWTPTESQGPGTYTVTVRVADSVSPPGTDSKTFSVNVTEVNATPVIVPVGNKSASEGTELRFTVVATDSDIPAQVLTYSLGSNAPSGAIIDPLTGVFSWTPAENQGPGSNSVIIRVTDNGEPPRTQSETIGITVAEINSAPNLNPIGTKGVRGGTLLNFTATATDSDLPAQTLRFSLDPGAPATATIDPVTGLFSWRPTVQQAPSTNTVTVRVTDNGSPPLDDFETIAVVVTEANASPVLNPISNRTIAEGTTLTFTATATDPDVPAQPLTFLLDPGAPAGATINPTNGIFVWTPTEAQGPATNSITVRVVDNGFPQLSDFKIFTVVVTEVESPPVIAPIGNRTAIEGILLTFAVSASDPDVPARSLTYSLVTAPLGAAIDPVTGIFTWTPTEQQGSTTNSVVIRATENGPGGLSETAAITIVVLEANNPPLLVPIGNKNVAEGALLSFPVLASDGDLPAQQLTFSLDPGAPTGASIHPLSGLFSWTPSEEQGPSTNVVTIRVTDNGSPPASQFETITIVVAEVNSPPSLNLIGNRAVAEGTLLTFTATARDSDFPAQQLLFTLDAGAPSGAFIDPITGVFTWTPTEAQGPSTNTITIRVTDTPIGGAPALSTFETILVVVSEGRSPPNIVPIPPQTAPEGALLTFTVVATDNDVPPDTFIFSLQGAPVGASINPTNGVFRWTPTETQGPSTNNFLVRATETGDSGLAGTASITVIVTEVNSGPVLSLVAARTIAENTPITFTVSATDNDVPAQTLTYSLDAPPAGASIDPITGVFNWTPTESQGPFTNVFLIRVTDNGSPPLSDFFAMIITVTESNAAPTMTPIGNKSIVEGNLLTFTATGSDIDLPAQTLRFSVDANAPSGASINPVTGVFTWTPTEAQGPSTNFVSIRLTDNAAVPLSASETIMIVVLESNAPPVLAPIGSKAVRETHLLTFTAFAIDPDLPAQALTYSLDPGAPVGAAINPVTGVFTWTPTVTQGPATNVITVRVTDNSTPSLSDSETLSIIVTESNTEPDLAPIGNKTVAEGSLLTFTASATDPENQTLTFSLDPGAPVGAVIHPISGVFFWTPTEADGPGTNFVTVRVRDNGQPALDDFETVRIVVTEVNGTPSLAPISDATIPEGVPFVFTAEASDPDLPPQTLTFSLGPGAPAGATIDPTTGVFSWTPSEPQGPGTNVITIRARDNGVPLASNSQSFVVIVLETNNAPVITAIGDKTIPESALLTFTVRATDSDLPAQALTFSLDEGAPLGASIHPTTGVFSWAPEEWQGPSTNIITIRVTDSASPPASSSETIDVIVTEVNRPPVFEPLANRTAPEGALLTFTAEATDPDVPEQTVTYALAGAIPAGLSINAVNGVVTWTPSEAQGPSTNVITIRAIDNGSPPASNSTTLTIVVAEANIAPIISPIGNKAGVEGQLLTFTVIANDFDLPPQPLTYSLDAGAPLGATINSTSGVFSWTPSEAQGPSTNTIVIRVTDDGSPGLSATEAIQVIVSEAASAPVIAAIPNKSVAEGSQLTFAVQATDADLPPQVLTFSLASGAPMGASINPITGVFNWIPSEAQGPSTNFIAVLVADNGQPPLSATQTVRVVVTEVNSAPVLTALPDRIVPEGTLLTFIANAIDSDLPPQSLTFSLGAGAPAGAAINPTSGIFTWTPTEAQGPSTNTITVNAIDNGVPPITDSVTFNVIVLETNNAPILQPIGDKTVAEGTTLFFTARATDSDLPAQALSYSLDEGAPIGAAINPVTGIFTWTPDEFQGPSTNTLTVRVTDNGTPPVSSAESIRIVVSEVNSAPVLPPISPRTVAEGSLLTFAAEAEDSDIPEQSLTYSLAGNIPAGATIDPVNGVVSWTPSEAQGPGTNTLTIRVVDNGLPPMTNSVNVTVTVTEVNVAPVLALIGNKAIGEGTLLTFTAQATDADIPVQPLAYTLDPGAPAGAAINRNTGVFTWTPSETQAPSTNSITVRVTDSGVPALMASETIIVIVSEANAAPVLTPIGNKSVNEGSLLTFNAVGTDSDVPAQTLFYTMDNGSPPGAALDPVTGLFTWRPTEAQGPATNFVTIRVTDDGAPPLNAFETIRIVVNEVNTPPQLAPIPDVTVPEGNLLTLTAAGSDADLPPQTLTYSLALGSPAGAAINPVTGVFTWTPSESQGPGTNIITVRVVDNFSPPGTGTVSFTVIVLETNNAPNLQFIGDKTVAEGATLTFTARATDSDLPVQALTFSLDEGAPIGASINPATGVFTWRPEEWQAPSTNTVIVRVTDNGSPPASSFEVIRITAQEVNAAPSLPAIAARTVGEGTLATFTAEASDIDVPEQSLTYLLAGNVPAGATIDPNNGVFSWTPSETQGPSTNIFTVRVIDSGSPPMSNSVTVTIEVTEVNLPPVLSPIANIAANEGNPITFTAQATDPDVPVQRLRFTLDGIAPVGASINSSNGVFSWTPTETQSPSTNIITVRVSDNGVPILSAVQNVTIVVTEMNVAPVVTAIPNKTVAEGSLLTFTAAATDADVPAQDLIFRLGAGSPAGAAIDPFTGVFTWTPTEPQGPSTNIVTIEAIDNGAPPLLGSGTVQIIVTEVNAAPTLPAISPKVIGEGSLLTFGVTAIDSDLPPQSFTFSLVAGPPAGASINPATGIFSWVPSEAQGPSTNTVSIRVTDSGSPALSATQTVLITVFETNNAPALSPIGDKTISEGVLLTFTARGTDSDLPAQALTYSIDEGAPLGATINPASGVFSWTPQEWQGPTTNIVTIRVTDNGSPAASSFEVIRIIVNEVNSAPVLPAITNRTVSEGTLVSFSAEALDSDVPEQTLTYLLAGNVPLGANIDPNNGVFTWIPNEAQAPSTNTFIIRVVDDGTPRMSNSLTLTIIVGEANVAPVINPIPDQTVIEGNLLSFPVIATDADVPAQRLRYTLDGPAKVGISINSTSGIVTWRPTEDQGPSSNPVSIRVTDSGVPPLSSVVTLNIIVLESNTPPVLAAIPNKTVAEGTLLTFTVSATDSDIPAQPLRFTLDPGAPAGASIDPGTGVFTWTPSEAQGPATNSITVRVTEEPNGLTDAKTFTVVVTELNAAPVIAPITDKSVAEGVLFIFTIPATDSDSPGQTLSYTLVTAPTGATLNPTTGIFSWTPTEEQGPSTNTITVRVSDNAKSPLTATASFVIVVTEANAAPVITPLPTQFVNEGDLLTFNVAATDSDLPAQRLTFSLEGTVPTGAIIDPVTGLFSWTPSETNGPGTNIITVRVADNGAPVRTATLGVTVVVNEVNVAPILATIGNKAATRGSTLRFTASATDADLPRQTLTFTLDPGAPAGATISPSSGSFSWEPRDEQAPSTNVVTIRVTDSGTPPYNDSETFLIVVDGANFAPVLASIGNKSVAEGSLLSFTASATDPDAGQLLTFTLAGPTGANIDSQTGQFTWTPAEDQGPGSYAVTIAVTDNGQPPITDVETFTINVTEVNTAPDLPVIADRVTSRETTLSFTIAATDSDIPAQNLTYRLSSGAPSGATINPTTGLFEWTPSDSQSPSTNTITVTVTDNGSPNLSASRSFRVIVSEEPGNLKLSMFASPDSVGRGEIVTYNLVVSNQGPGVAVGVLLTNFLPANATFSSAIPEAVLAPTDSTLVFDLGALPPGETTNVLVSVKTVSAGTVVDSAVVGCISGDTDLQDNAASASAAVGADPALSVGDAVLSEVNKATSMATFEITLSASSRKAIQVEYFTARNTAVPTKDFTTTRNIIKFPPGTTRRVVRIPVVGDTLPELDETFFVRLRKPVNARIRRSQGIGTIRNNDADPAISISDARVTEGNTVLSNAVFTVRLSRVSGKTITVNFSTSDGTALGGLDYVATNGSITFPAGILTRPLRIPVFSERLSESNETFYVHLSDAVNASIADGEGLATILDTDPGPRIFIDDASASESAGAMVFNVRLSTESGRAVSVAYTTANGQALAGSDYIASTGRIVFPPGVTNLPVSVPILADAIIENSETFVVNLSAPIAGTIADGRAIGTIVDSTPLAFSAPAPDPGSNIENPDSASDALRITGVAILATDVQISFNSVEGRTYVIEYTEDIVHPDWQAAAEPVVGTGGSMTVTHADGAARPLRFYRVRVVE